MNKFRKHIYIYVLLYTRQSRRKTFSKLLTNCFYCVYYQLTVNKFEKFIDIATYKNFPWVKLKNTIFWKPYFYENMISVIVLIWQKKKLKIYFNNNF